MTPPPAFELPPLPQPPHYSANPMDAWEPSEDLWDESQVRSFAQLAVNEALESAAKKAESDEFYGGTVQHAIAAAIRAMKKP